MGNPYYCSTGWQLYYELASTIMNLETGEEYSPEKFDKEKNSACQAKLDEHLRTRAQCSLEEKRFEKKRPARTMASLPDGA
jgi:hypothetical protein